MSAFWKIPQPSPKIVTILVGHRGDLAPERCPDVAAGRATRLLNGPRGRAAVALPERRRPASARVADEQAIKQARVERVHPEGPPAAAGDLDRTTGTDGIGHDM